MPARQLTAPAPEPARSSAQEWDAVLRPIAGSAREMLACQEQGHQHQQTVHRPLIAQPATPPLTNVEELLEATLTASRHWNAARARTTMIVLHARLVTQPQACAKTIVQEARFAATTEAAQTP